MILWILVFIVSLMVLIKSADWLILSAEKIGLSLGLSSFTVGLIIVSLGTSLPELAGSLVATFRGLTDFAVSNAIGSNIANILLIVGFSAVIGKSLKVTKSLIDLDLPLLVLATVLLLGVTYNGKVVLLESILLIVAYLIYIFYTISFKETNLDKETLNLLPSKEMRKRHITLIEKHKNKRLRITRKDILLFLLGVIGLTLASKYLIDSVINLSAIFNIAPGIIAVTAVAIGTSLPELFVCIRAVLQKRSEMALGNIFGSNVFNALVVIGIPGLISTLEVEQQTLLIGLPVMALTTLCFVISSISRKIHNWEGGFYLILYLFFILKIFNLI